MFGDLNIFRFILLVLMFVVSMMILIVSPNVISIQYCAGDKIEKNETDRACGTYGGRERCSQGFGGET